MLIYSDKNNNLINNNNENDLISNNNLKNSDLNKKVLNYKCKNIFNVMFKRIYKKIIIITEIKNELKIINTLKIFIKIKINDDNLKHVYYKHFL